MMDQFSIVLTLFAGFGQDRVQISSGFTKVFLVSKPISVPLGSFDKAVIMIISAKTSFINLSRSSSKVLSILAFDQGDE